ncbi:MAG: putative primase/helicase, partial [Thermomicrobiales bacterium]|nr:putative primase/helicase [Thermomicrobiales bacterium]
MSSRTDILFQDVASPSGIVTEIRLPGALPGIPTTRDAPIPITSAPSRSRLGREATEASYFGSNGFEVPALAFAVDAASPIRVDEDGILYAYVDGYYAVDGVRRIGELATELLGRRFRRNHVNEVVAWFKNQPPTIPADPDTAVLNVQNGLLGWRTGRLAPHTPAHPSTIRIPVAWNPTARCPRIAAFLAQVLAPDAREFVLEIAGYALYAGNPFRKAILLLGPGGNGKSTFLRLVSALLGTTNIANVSLHTLQSQRFAVAQLRGKLANIAGDLDARPVEGSDVFKQLTGGDRLYAERKYEAPFAFTSFALPLFSANQAPPSSDQTEAWFDRWLVVAMTRRFGDGDQGSRPDPELSTKLTTPDELSGFLNL